ncbi:MAG TPA: riboflavin biosynthesis protein RibF [Chloroflexota bacterium]|nr:riboflavin biosynthesis protein RibF [Chloroflexota bacterium]
MAFVETLIDTLIAARIRRPSVVTVGTFDGVHVGHQHLLNDVVCRAHVRDALAVAITFHPRPTEVLRPDAPSLYLCSLDARLDRLREAGAEVVIPIAFTRELSQISAFDFARALVEHMRMCELVGGPDLALGHDREGTPAVLRDIGARLGFVVNTVPVVDVQGETARSSVLHRAIGDGAVGRAALLLGRRYDVSGDVVQGDGRGRTIGVPTANVAVSEKILLPGNGVYAVFFYEGGRRWLGAANVGVRPTFAGTTRSLEVHLLDFTGDLRGAPCTVEFVERLRAEIRFAGVAELVQQIHQDVERAREILGAGG